MMECKDTIIFQNKKEIMTFIARKVFFLLKKTTKRLMACMEKA